MSNYDLRLWNPPEQLVPGLEDFNLPEKCPECGGDAPTDPDLWEIFEDGYFEERWWVARAECPHCPTWTWIKAEL
jgi:hypothetical protein